MSSRSSFRRKMVLAVMVIRQGGREKQLAHTLDLTEASARLGGLVSPLEPGEIIEVQRGAVKAKFRVIWMGSPDGALAYQAGIRGLDERKSIWNIDLPEDKVDAIVDTAKLRQPTQFSPEPLPATERRWHERYPCNGSASIKTARTSFAIQGQTKDISKGGVYIEMNAPLPVNSKATLDLLVEDIRFQATGVVRTSYPLLGMGIHFQELTAENSEKLAVAVERARRRSNQGQEITPALPGTLQISSIQALSAFTADELSLEDSCASISLLTAASRSLAHDFDRWKETWSRAQMEELRVAIDQLQKKLWAIQETGFMQQIPEPLQTDQSL